MSKQESAAWGRPSSYEARWPASVAVLAALLLYVILPKELTLGPLWLVPVLELTLLVPLAVAGSHPGLLDHTWVRKMAITLIAVVNAANVASLVLLVHELFVHGSHMVGQRLFFSSASIWLTNVIVYALWYWELDRGGPVDRRRARHQPPDFLFPQMVTPESAPKDWSPIFMDYLYVAFTNATAFSPTDTMPLTVWAKTLMGIQSLVSLLTVALVAARAVNILT